MSFTNSSVLVLTNTGTTHSFQTAQSSPISVSIPSGATGIWTWVVSREGYSTQLGTFDVTGGGVDSASPTPQLLTQANGTTLFTGSSSAFVSIAFDLTLGSERCYIDIGNGSVTAQQVIDEIETALLTENGCKFLAATNGSQSTFSVLAGQTYLLLGTKYRVRRASAGDVNASIEAFVISADGTPLDGVNGGVQFLVSSGGGSSLTEAQIYTYFTSSGREDAFKADLTGIALEATSQTINTKVQSLNNYNDATLQSKVDTIDTVVDAIKSKTDTLVNTDLTGIATATNITDAQTAIIAEVNANETKIDAVKTVVDALENYDDTILIGKVDVIDGVVDAIKAKTDTLVNTDLSLVALEATSQTINTKVQSLNNYDDTVLQGKVDVIDTNVDAILVDTNELQTNQGDWITATGFSTHSVTDVVTALQAVANDFKADTAPILSAISALNNISLTEIEGSTVLAKEVTLAAIVTAIAAIPTTDSVADLTPVLTAISNLNDVTPSEVRAAFNEADFKDKNTELEIHAWLDSYANKDLFKADISALATSAEIAALNDISAVDVWAAASRTLTDKAGFALNSAEYTSIANAVQSAIINEGDGQQVINAIVQAIGNSNLDQLALVAAIRADLERTGGSLAIIDTVVDSIKAKTDTLNSTDLTGIEADLLIINNGVKKASLGIPHNTNL